MSSYLHTRTWLLLATLAISQQSLAQDNNGIISDTANSSNPFEFKPKAPPKPEPVQQIVVRDEKLSAQQRETVAEMIKVAVDATKMQVPDVNEVEIDGEKFVLLKSGDRYLGVTSGMYVVFSKLKNDYDYYDTKKFKRVMSEAEYKDIMAESKSNLEKAIEAVRKGAEIGESEEQENILSRDAGIRPLPLSNKDD